MAFKLPYDQKVIKGKIALMSHPLTMLYSGVMMLMETDYSDAIPTAMTNGVKVVYSPAFIDSLDQAETNGVILHETLHMMYRHLWQYRKLYLQQPQIANAACDFYINLVIEDIHRKNSKLVKLPEGALIDEKYRDMAVVEIYNDLMKHAKPVPRNGKGQPQDDSGQTMQDANGNPLENFDKHDWESADGMSDEEKDSMSERIETAIRQSAIHASKLGGDVSRLGELTEPRVPWEQVMRDFVSSRRRGTDMATWSRLARRGMQLGMVLPHKYTETMGRLAFCVDTSGSIGQEELNAFMTEAVAICNSMMPDLVDIIYWDDGVASHELYDPSTYHTIMQVTKPKGGGGTDPSCIPEYLASNNIRPECAVIITDGYVYGGWGNWSCPTLWAITTKKIQSPIGETVFVDMGY